jgi:hypothetical protein
VSAKPREGVRDGRAQIVEQQAHDGGGVALKERHVAGGLAMFLADEIGSGAQDQHARLTTCGDPRDRGPVGGDHVREPARQAREVGCDESRSAEYIAARRLRSGWQCPLDRNSPTSDSLLATSACIEEGVVIGPSHGK